jgi:hypothetical protein
VNRRGKASIVEPVDYGIAELHPDRERPGGWTLLLDGYPQSYVDVGDPGHLEFEYVRRLASVVDLAAPLGEPLSVLHLGGGALTMPRYVAATRPRSSATPRSSRWCGGCSRCRAAPGSGCGPPTRGRRWRRSAPCASTS